MQLMLMLLIIITLVMVLIFILFLIGAVLFARDCYTGSLIMCYLCKFDDFIQVMWEGDLKQ